MALVEDLGPWKKTRNWFEFDRDRVNFSQKKIVVFFVFLSQYQNLFGIRFRGTYPKNYIIATLFRFISLVCRSVVS